MTATWRIRCLGALTLWALGAAQAQTPPPLPQPLTLTDALALADEPHPQLQAAQAALALAHAERAAAHARDGTRAYLDLTPQQVRPVTEEALIDDTRARLIVNKSLYDFGRTQAFNRSAESLVQARMHGLFEARAQRRLEIMTRFFEVVLADMRYAVDNEAMASAYVEFDRVRERRALGQLSDVDLLEAESRYQDLRAIRTASLARQNLTRRQLAYALNRPHEVPVEVAPPALPALVRDTPEFDAVFARVRAQHPRLSALRREAEAARAQIDAERARRRPALTAEAEAAYYRREFLSRDDLRASLNLRVPLYQGGEDRAALLRAHARVDAQDALVASLELELRDALWGILNDIDTLKVQRETAAVRSAYRDLYLDRSRTLYELEVRTDLGDALIKNTEAAWLAAQADFNLALAWARLAALLGELPANPLEEAAP